MSAAPVRPAPAISSWRRSPRASWWRSVPTAAARCGTNRWSAATARRAPSATSSTFAAGPLAAVDLQSGQRQWDRNIGGSQTPWVAGRFVFVVSNSADVVALDRTSGKVKWVTPLTQYLDDKRQKPILWAGPVLAGDRLLVGGTTGELLSLSPYTGEIMAKLDLKAPIRLAPVVSNRTIYVLTDSGRLIALR